MIAYANPDIDINGNICDFLFEPKCDHYFTFCIDDANSSNLATDICRYWGPYKTSVYKETDTIDFLADFRGIPNPFYVYIDHWTDNMALKVFVEDNDVTIFSGADDPVDNFYVELRAPFSPLNRGNRTLFLLYQPNVTLLGLRSIKPSKLAFRYAIECNKNFYGPNCSIYCDEASESKYACDRETGLRILSSAATCHEPVLDDTTLQIMNAKFTGDYSEGEDILFHCAEGYVIKGPTTRKCEKDIFDEPYWSDYNPACVPVRCPDPGTPPNCQRSGSTEGELFLYGTNLTYTPTAGFRLVGSPFLICSSTGRWMGDMPQCLVGECPTLPMFDNGIRSTEARILGTIVQFNCHEGHRMEGNAKIMCGYDALWHGQQPRCVATNGCRSLTTKDAPKNGHLLCVELLDRETRFCRLLCNNARAEMGFGHPEFVHCGRDTNYQWSFELLEGFYSTPTCLDPVAELMANTFGALESYSSLTCNKTTSQSDLSSFIWILSMNKQCSFVLPCVVVKSNVVCGENI